MSQINFDNLWMSITSNDNAYSLSFLVTSGFVDYEVTISITKSDFEVIKNDSQRTAFLQAALHHPFQLQKTRLNDAEQRHSLDMILHAPITETEAFLTELDNGEANGAISNMVRITCGKEQFNMQQGHWFNG